MTLGSNSHHIILWNDGKKEFYVWKTYQVPESGLDVIIGQNLWFDLHAGDTLQILCLSDKGVVDVLATRNNGNQEEYPWTIAYADLASLGVNLGECV